MSDDADLDQIFGKVYIAMPITQHTRQVRALYKGLLRLHRGLPFQLQAMGDQYVKDEFRRHKEVPKAEADIFMTEWTVSAVKSLNSLDTQKITVIILKFD